MNKIEKNDSRSLKREKLKNFLSERRSQKEAQARAIKETARRLTSERRTRLVSERGQARQRKEALKEIKIKSRVKINAVKSDKTASLSSRPKLEKRKVFTGGKTQPGSGKEEDKPFFSASVNNQQAEKRQKLLSYLEKHRVKKFEIIAGKIKQKKAAAGEKQARLAELKRQKQSLRQQKLASQSQQKAEAAALLAQKRKEAEVLQAQQKKEVEVRREEKARKAEAAGAQKEAGKQEIVVQRQALTANLEKERAISKENIPALIGQPYKHRQLLLCLIKLREAKAEVLVRKQEQKKAAAGEKQARLAELKRQKQSLRQQKLASQSQQKAEAAALLAQKRKEAEVLQAQQKKEVEVRREEKARKAEAAGAQKEAGKQEIVVQRQALTANLEKERAISKENIPVVIGQPYKRRQLLSYLKKRKAGEKIFVVQRRDLKKIVEEAPSEVSSAPVVSEIIPIIVPLVTPLLITPPEIVEAVPEKVLAPMEEKPVLAAKENPTGRRLKLLLARGKKIPSDPELPEPIVIIKPPRKPFRIVPFLKAHFIKIIFLLLVLGWFVEIALLNKRLENVRQQIEQAASITIPRVSGGAITTAKISSPNLGTTRVEGIRDPFSNELWRIQEITPAQARAVGIRPVKMPVPSSIIKPITPILIIKPPEFTLPEVARAIPESAKLVRIPQVTIPQVGSVSTSSAPVSSLRFRGILNVAGIDYFFVEGASGGYRVRVGDTVEGFKIYDYRNGVLYFVKDGDAYQLNEERASPPLRYRGRMIMAGQEYFFLEGQRTYRAVIGEEIEGYHLVKRVGDYLYFVKDDRLYYLKQE